MAGPIVASALLSLTDFGLRDLRNPLGTNVVGLQNYIDLIADAKFIGSLVNTAYFVIIGVPLTLVLGLAAALALDRGIRRFRSLYRVGYYLPVVTSIVAIAVVWRYVLNPDFGLLNMGLVDDRHRRSRLAGEPRAGDALDHRDGGLAQPRLRDDRVHRRAADHPAHLYEAAAIDGAGRWASFRHVTFPLLRPTILFATVITTIGYLQLFEEPFVMTDGGPLDRTLSVSMYMYQEGFKFFHQGYAAAIAWVLFLIVAAVAFVQFRVLRSET